MEAVKCPNCGSEKVQELTEEKYVCLACDNVFLVHNLSKEFRQTDEHITNIHQDLSEKLGDLDKKLSADSGVDITRAREVLFEAKQNLEDGKWEEAYQGFKKYAILVPDSSVGFEEMYYILADKNVIKRHNDIYNGFDVLKKALECEDCDKETILNFALQKYRDSDKIFYAEWEQEASKECTNLRLQHTNLIQDIQQLIQYYDEKIEEHESAKESAKKAASEFEKLSQKGQLMMRLDEMKWLLIPSYILLLVGLLLFGGFLCKLCIVISVIWAFFMWICTKPRELSDDSLYGGDKERSAYWKNKLEILNSKGNLQISDMERIICSEFGKGKTADEVIKKEKIKEEDRTQGYWKVKYDSNRESFKAQSLGEEKVRKYAEKNNIDWVDCLHLSFGYVSHVKKSQAYDIQKLLLEAGISNVTVERE